MSQQRISPLGQLGILVGLMIFGLIVGALVVAFLAKFVYGISLLNMQAALMKPQYIGFSRIAQTLSSFFMLAVPALLFGFITQRKALRYVGFTRMISGKQFFLVVLIAFAGLIASDFFGVVNEWLPIPKNAATYFKQLENTYDDAVMSLAGMKSIWDYIISLIVLAFLPAVFEELFFRGALQQVMISLTKNAIAGILITAVFFSAIHLSYYGFLPRAFLGVMLGYIFYYSKNIWLNITVHFLNNAVAVTQLYSLSKAGKLTPDAMNDSSPLYIGILGLFAIIALLISFKKESELVISLHSIKRNTDEWMD